MPDNTKNRSGNTMPGDEKGHSRHKERLTPERSFVIDKEKPPPTL